MKRVSRLLVAIVIALVPIAFGASVSAKATCQIGFTGPDSKNMCTSTVAYECKVTNTNTVTITNTNTQEAVSGTVSTSDNTQGGTTTSGTVANTNGSTFNVVIKNSTNQQDPDTCTAVLTVPATEPPKPVQPVNETTPPPSLPGTSSGSGETALMVVLGTLGLAALGTTIGTLLYRRSKA